MNDAFLVEHLRAAYPEALAGYVFGSRATGAWGPDSDLDLAERLKRMVGFRNLAVHDDQALHLPIVVAILEQHLDDFLTFNRVLLQRDR